MLTIVQALEMEVFALARVVAGEAGLDKPIQWVHMVDIPEMANWSQEGELLFTTAFGLKDNPDLQATLILLSHHSAALGSALHRSDARHL